MSLEKNMLTVEDKAISTSDEMFMNLNSGELCVVTIEKFVNTLINNKLLSIREMESINDFDDSESSMYSLVEHKEKEPPDKRSSKEQKHCSRCPKYRKNEESSEHRSSISKVQKLSDEYDPETSLNYKNEEESGASPQERTAKAVTDDDQKPPAKKRKRKKKRKMSKKISHIDPEDLPKRARWTIIITSGLLIISCMFLVGITLRMAPVIDQMVRTQNEELMNSLNRDTDANPAYYSIDMWEKSPQERAKAKYGQ